MSYGDARSRSTERSSRGRCRPALVRSALVERRRRIIEAAGADAGGANSRDQLPQLNSPKNCKLSPCSHQFFS